MGGSYYRPPRKPREIDLLETNVRESISKSRRNLFISFASEDKDLIELLRGQFKNEKVDINVNDWSLKEPIDSERASYIKLRIIEKIMRTSKVIVFLSDNTNKSDWVKWEVNESIKQGKDIVCVRVDESNEVPDFIIENSIEVIPWKQDKIKAFIERK